MKQLLFYEKVLLKSCQSTVKHYFAKCNLDVMVNSTYNLKLSQSLLKLQKKCWYQDKF